MYFITYLSTYPPSKNGPTQQNNVPEAHQGANTFLPKFFWTSKIPIPPISLLLVVLGPLEEELHFQGGLHANYMRILWYHRNHRKVPFWSKIFAEIFLHLNEHKPNNIPKFRRNWRTFIFLPISTTPPIWSSVDKKGQCRLNHFNLYIDKGGHSTVEAANATDHFRLSILMALTLSSLLSAVIR